MKKISKKQLMLVVITLCLIGLIGIGISYAYYVSNFNVENSNNSESSVTSAATTNVILDISNKQITSGSVLPGHISVKKFTIRGEGPSNAQPTEASIKIIPDLGIFKNDVTWELYESSEEVTCTSDERHIEGQYYEESTCNIPENAKLELNGSSKNDFKNIIVYPNTEIDYYLVIKYANNGNQDNQQGQDFTINIDLGNKGIKSVSAVEKITTLANEEIDNFDTNDSDNNVRYIGKSPNNYIYFNCDDYNNQTDNTCEKWRIIGVFNNVITADEKTKSLVKIIRDENIGHYAWDYTSSGSYQNDWSTSTLQVMLNSGAYYNSTVGTYYNGSTTTVDIDFTKNGLKNDETRDAIQSVVWNLGGTSDEANSTASIYYSAERSNNVYTGRPTIWTGKIGLMYPSDYGYATGGGTTTNRNTCLSTPLVNWYKDDVSDCKNNNYLYNGDYQSTLTSYIKNRFGIYCVRSDGYVYAGYSKTNFFGIRPTVFLDYDLSIKSGNGTADNPYQLSV